MAPAPHLASAPHIHVITQCNSPHATAAGGEEAAAPPTSKPKPQQPPPATVSYHNKYAVPAWWQIGIFLTIIVFVVCGYMYNWYSDSVMCIILSSISLFVLVAILAATPIRKRLITHKPPAAHPSTTNPECLLKVPPKI